MTFSGGSREDVARWLRNFLASHAKRVDPRVEVVFEAGAGADSYVAHLRLGRALSDPLVFGHEEVAAGRGSLAWCRAAADRVQELARTLVPGEAGAAQAR